VLVETKRQLSPVDVDAVHELLAAAERADGHPALSDHLRLDLLHGGRPGFAGLLARATGGEPLAAYVQVSRANESAAVELVVHPDRRRDLPELGVELLRAALGAIAADGGGTVRWWVAEPSATHVAVASAIGLVPGRELHQLRRPLPAGIPFELDTRPFEVGRDEEAWLAVNNRAFADHGEQGGWDLETIHRRETEAWFDPSGFLLHERDGRLAGFCWTKVHRDATPALGEIYVIAVDPDYHGLGLGRALTLAGLDHLAGRGIATGMLYVDADNTAAMAMYERLGFGIHRTDRAFDGAV
jgi:mycothiol synthase